MTSKYKVVKTRSGTSKKVIVAGVKKVLYKKEGSTKLYVATKGKMMNIVKYKKLKSTKTTKSTKSTKTTKSTKKR